MGGHMCHTAPPTRSPGPAARLPASLGGSSASPAICQVSSPAGKAPALGWDPAGGRRRPQGGERTAAPRMAQRPGLSVRNRCSMHKGRPPAPPAQGASPAKHPHRRAFARIIMLDARWHDIKPSPIQAAGASAEVGYACMMRKIRVGQHPNTALPSRNLGR